MPPPPTLPPPPPPASLASLAFALPVVLPQAVSYKSSYKSAKQAAGTAFRSTPVAQQHFRTVRPIRSIRLGLIDSRPFPPTVPHRQLLDMDAPNRNSATPGLTTMTVSHHEIVDLDDYMDEVEDVYRGSSFDESRGGADTLQPAIATTNSNGGNDIGGNAILDDAASATSTEWSVDLDAAEQGGTDAAAGIVMGGATTNAVHRHVSHRHRSSPFAIRRGQNLQFRHVSLFRTISKTKPPQLPFSSSKKSDDDGGDLRTTTTTTTTTTAVPDILCDCWGAAPAGQVTAILGSSGSGKTSLLNVLSGRTIDGQNGLSLQLDMMLDNTSVDPSHIQIRQLIAFVAQDDSLPVTATPREAILFSARLRLPKSTPFSEIQDLAENMLDELRLNHCADTYVGGPTLKGISGGERKRTSVGVELVTRPSLVFLDEATSGLDSFNALELVAVLKKVALAGSAVLTTIHQPSSEIFSSLDNLILLEKGRVLYGGTVANVPQYFADRGFPCPAHYNPADWILTIAQTRTLQDLQSRGFFALPEGEGGGGGDYDHPTTESSGGAARRRRTLPKKLTAQERRESAAALVAAAGAAGPDRQRPGIAAQTRLLFQRELQNVRRNKKNLGARTGMTLVSSVLGGIIFFQVAKTDFAEFINVQSTFGALLMSCLANVFSTALPSLVAFPEERPVFIREYSTNHYGVTAYFASRLTVEAVVTAGQVCLSTVLTYFLIGFSASFGVFWAVCYALAMTSTALGVLLGCAVKDPGMAIEFLPLIMMPQILFAGFFVPPELIPIWLRWLQYVFPLTYAVKLVVVAEFDTACDGIVPNYCDQVLTNLQAHPEDVWWYWLVLVGQFLLFRTVALVLLRHKASQFY